MWEGIRKEVATILSDIIQLKVPTLMESVSHMDITHVITCLRSYTCIYNGRCCTSLAVCSCTGNGGSTNGVPRLYIMIAIFVHGSSIFGHLYSNDPLWDGAGRRGHSTCCSFNSPPWFMKQLCTNDALELRVCRDQPRSGLKIVELYVQ